MKSINIEKIGAFGFCMIVTFISSMTYLKVDKIYAEVPVIKTEIKENTRSIGINNIEIQGINERTQDNREQLLILKATQPLKKGAVTTKNLESTKKNIELLNLIHQDNKRVDKLAQQDIIINY